MARTVEQLLKVYYPGLVFGGAVGFLFNIFINLRTFTNELVLKFLGVNAEVYGGFVILSFAIGAALVQYYNRWGQ